MLRFDHKKKIIPLRGSRVKVHTVKDLNALLF